MTTPSNAQHERERQASDMSSATPAAVNSVFYHLIDPNHKAQVFAAVRACAGMRANAQQHKRLLADRARLIRNFHVFRSLVQEDLREAYIEDRQNKTRTAANRRRAWMNLFKPFAGLRGIKQAMAINALDRQGIYECELVDKESPGHWDKLVKLAAEYGLTEAYLLAGYRHAQEARTKRA